MTVQIRQIRPSDYRPVIAVIDGWWDGRQMADMLPRLFFEHFTETSFAAERDGEVVGFLVGFLSQSRLGEAYIHFVGVHPAERGRGLGRQLYQRFFAAARVRRTAGQRAGRRRAQRLRQRHGDGHARRRRRGTGLRDRRRLRPPTAPPAGGRRPDRASQRGARPGRLSRTLSRHRPVWPPHSRDRRQLSS